MADTDATFGRLNIPAVREFHERLAETRNLLLAEIRRATPYVVVHQNLTAAEVLRCLADTVVALGKCEDPDGNDADS